MELAITKTILVYILVISSPVELQLLARLPNQAQLTTSLVGQVVLLVEILVVDKALQPAIETSNGPSQIF